MPISTPDTESSFASDPVDQTASTVTDPASPADLVSHVTATIRGKDVNIHFDMGELTPRLRKRLAALDNDEDGESALVDYLQTIITGWDLTDRKGNTVSLNDIDAVPYRDLGIIMSAISGAVSPNA
jgi:hypothetical protein